MAIILLLVTFSGCGGDGQERPAYDWSNHDASWVDKTRGQSNALVSRGDTVCSTRAHDLYCLDGHSGDEIFTEQLPGTATSPSLAGDILVVGDDSGPGGVLYAYSLDGQKQWSLPLDGHDVGQWASQPGAPLNVAGDVVVWTRGTAPSAELVAVQTTSGRERWHLPATDVGVYTDGEHLITTTDDRSVVALDPDSGAELWRAEADEVANDGTIVSVKAVMGGTAVAVTVDGQPRRVVILDTASGDHRWDVDLDAETTSDVSITSSDDLIYINDDDFLITYDGAGGVQWGAPAAGGSLGTRPAVGLVAEHGRLFTLSDDVWYIQGGGGGRLIREDVNPSDIAVIDDQIVIAGNAQLEAVPLAQR